MRVEFSHPTRRDALRRSEKRCEATGCSRAAVTLTVMGECCNLHYQRVRKHGSFDLPYRARSREVICANCRTPFDRGYPIAQKRAHKPQYCSDDCRHAASAQRAVDTLASRFWSKVAISHGACWEWRGRRNDRGYGLFDVGGTPRIASRISYALNAGELATGKFVCHSCDNPPCVNPDHLWLGTHEENIADASAKGRLTGANSPARGSAVATSRLTEPSVRAIRSSGLSNQELAVLYGVSDNAIRLIRLRVNWGWLDE